MSYIWCILTHIFYCVKFVCRNMTHKLNITIDVEKLKFQQVLPEILQILELIRPEWKIEDIQVKVSDKQQYYRIKQ